MGSRRRLVGLLGIVALEAIPAMLDPCYLLDAYPALALGVFAGLASSLGGKKPIGPRAACVIALAVFLLFGFDALMEAVGAGPRVIACARLAPYAVGGFAASSIYASNSSSNKGTQVPRLAVCLALCLRGLVLPLGIIAGYGFAATDQFAFVGPMPRTWAVVAPWLALSLAGCAIAAVRLARPRSLRLLAEAFLQVVMLILLIDFIAYGNNPIAGRIISLVSIVIFALEIFAGASGAPNRCNAEEALVALTADLCLTAVFLAANELPGLGLYPFVGQAYPSSSLVWALVAFCVVAQLNPPASEKAEHEPDAALSETEGPIVRVDGLSPRENEVLACLARGLTVAQTAAELSISPSSVGTYRSRIYKKLEVRSAQELRA